jgi:thiamine biosynthesis lipoprotein
MGTRFELVLGHGDSPAWRSIGEGALELIEEWHGQLSVFERHSGISHINAVASERAVRLDMATFELIDACLNVHRLSDGAFDVTVGAAMQGWGHHPTNGASTGTLPITKPVSLDRATRTIRLAEGVRLDFGAVGKGVALDAAAAVLREHGVTRALLHGGTSSVVAIGAPPGRSGWGVALGDPFGGHDIALCNQALAVSSAQSRKIGAKDECIGHLIDPRSSAPVALDRYAAVIGPSAFLADAWSTALAVSGTRLKGVPDDYTTAIPSGLDGTPSSAGPLADVLNRANPAEV